MSLITIQCHLKATRVTLRYLWLLMTEKNSLLVSEILEQINTHPDFDFWLSQGKIPATTIEGIVKNLKQQPKYQGAPSRFFDSAERLVKQIYKSWFAVQENKRYQLLGKRRWLAKLKSERELLELTGWSLSQLQVEAEKCLIKERKEFEQLKQEKPAKTKIPQNLFSYLNDLYDKRTQAWKKEKKPHLKLKKLRQRCVIVYLLKNNCAIGSKPEDFQRYQQYRRRKEIEVERLEQQLKGRLPKGRNLDTDEYLTALEQAESLVDNNESMELLQARLLRKEKSIPYPISYDSNTDVYWFKNKKGHLDVSFNGIKEDGYIFKVCCNKRQLHWFERFYEDYGLYEQHNEQVPGGLLTLRSARLVWQASEDDSTRPWLTNRLSLHCSVETQLWTAEGTEAIRQLKIAQTKQKIDNWLKKDSLNKNQQTKLLGARTSLRLLETFRGFSRPSKALSAQDPAIIMGVCIGLQQPVSIAVVDVLTGKVLLARDTKQLLNKPVKQKPKKGKKAKRHTQYEFLLRRRQQQQEKDFKRQQAQIKAGNSRFGESNLGEYVDRLLAKAIVEIAVCYRVSSIVLPDLTNIREILNSEITAQAEAKIPGVKKAQKLYAKKYRQNIHRWSYKRLLEAISSQATRHSIAVEHDTQEAAKTLLVMPAKDLALSAYYSR